MSWIPRWRDRVIRAESDTKKAQRDQLGKKVENLQKKQLKLTHVIQHNEEEYQRLVKEASMRRAPTQNGSARRAYLDSVSTEHGFQKSLRPPDRMIFSRMYSKVDDYTWQLDELKEWYSRNARPEDVPDMPLQHYGFKAVWKAGDEKSQKALDSYTALYANKTPQYLAPLPPPGPRESISSMQRRIVAKQTPDSSAGIHWSNDIAHNANQARQREVNPMYGRLDVVAPPFRPLPQFQ
mmetsp:Transcript_24238/g.46997  ORF Transcript_24238/g.46997 Transcript_24238/m.46997 type:complete len:237 (+) Transcript_24238:70-780(+)